jgi:hypothetical protein
MLALHEYIPDLAKNIPRSRPRPAFGPIPQDPSAGSRFILVIISLQVGALFILMRGRS